MNPPSSPHRPIRSFVRRTGRITPAQVRALAELLPRFSIAPGDTPIDLDTAFGRRAPVTIEIGFGNGEALLALAQAQPERNFLGVEVHRPGIGALLLQLAAHDIRNVRVVEGDATLILAHRIADNALDAVHIFFPDPWPKKRHHKRRLIQPAFIALLRAKLKPGAYLHLATDWQDYAEHVLAAFTEAEGFDNTAGRGHFAARPDYRPLTKFERRGQRLGHAVWDLVFVKSNR